MYQDCFNGYNTIGSLQEVLIIQVNNKLLLLFQITESFAFKIFQE